MPGKFFLKTSIFSGAQGECLYVEIVESPLLQVQVFEQVKVGAEKA